MSDNAKPEAGGQSFAEMFEAYEAGMSDGAQVGDRIAGKVISVGKEGVIVDTGSKVDGVAELEEFLGPDGNPTVAAGDQVELYVTAVSGSEIKLSKALSGQGGLAVLEEAKSAEVPVEGKVVGVCKGGYNVEILRRRAFCPASQMDVRFTENAETHVGQTYQFLILKLEQGGRNLVVSRRELLARAQAESRDEFLKNVKAGDVLDAAVVRLERFGAFMEIAPGLEGLAHISELSWSRVEDPSEAVKTGETVKVKILEIAPGKKPGQLRISLSVKQAQADPWTQAEGKFKAGDKMNAKVVRLAPFGAFAEIAPGIEGLIHVSEMSYVKRIHKPEDAVAVGQTVAVSVKDVDLANRRISLSMRDAEGDPWLEVPEKFKVGQAVAGTVEKQEKFGIFISLAPGVTGLLPKSRISRSQKPGDLEKLKPGDSVEVVVEELHPADRKITLTVTDAREDGDWKEHKHKGRGDRAPQQSHQQFQQSSQPFGLLGDKLQDALKAKKGK